ncbi:MAG: N-acetylmuramoyl-L-alanine amidase, partial [Armatimonadota bacterium]
GIDRSKGLQAWLDVVIKYAGLDEENSRFFAMEVFEKLAAGLDHVNSVGERFRFDPQDIGSVDLKSLEPPRVAFMGAPPILQSTDYPPAIWDPAPTCNYSTTWTTKDTVVIHTIEGTAAGARSWFKNCNSSVSAHYVIAENGTIWQMVREGQVAWHVSCYNSRSIGLEHEGYASSPSHPQTLYDASALLTRDICNDWGIPKEKRTVGPGILGHIDVTRCCCGTHTDPGNGWDWNYYIQQVQGTPPPPTWAATYHAQSYPSTMTAGETAVAWVEYVNNGTGTWTHGNTRLGTSSPQDRSSPFYNPANWIGPNRPTDVDQSSVTQGQIGRFTFILKAPSTPGVYVERYRLVQEGVTWFGDEIAWTITVNPARGNITGTVRNAANGQPISGAAVSISGGPSTSTNSSGIYTFSDVEAGNYTLNASASGFNPVSAPVTVNPGQTTTQDFSLTPIDTQPPTAPTNLTATAVSPSQINLSWTASSDNVGVVDYRVYRGGVEIGSTSATSFQDNGLSPNTTYSYFVKARDAANNLSAASNTANATTFPAEVPIFEDGFANLDYWENIVQSPMPGEYPPVIDSSRSHGTFCGANSIRTRTSAD